MKTSLTDVLWETWANILQILRLLVSTQPFGDDWRRRRMALRLILAWLIIAWLAGACWGLAMGWVIWEVLR